MTKEELNNILELHKKYLVNDGGKRADLRGTDLREADLHKADLSCANLCDANLCGADLSNADLRGADLLGANLNGADLCDADLSGATLEFVDLSDANLRNANLSGATLRDTIGNMKQIKSLQIEKYTIVYTSDIIQIGCKNYTIEKWKNFNDDTISEMDAGALEWWKKWKETIFKIIEMSPAEPTKG